MKKLATLSALLVLVTVGAASAQEPSAQQQIKPAQPAQQNQPAAPAQAPPAGAKPQSLEDRASYIIGFNLGSNLKQQEIPVSTEVIIRGLRDGLSGAQAALTDEEIQAAMKEFQEKMGAQQQAKMKAAGEKNKKEGDAFLAANKSKPGVTTTASGLQYQITQPGTGPKPKPEDRVTVHYKGTLIDGTVFDSSYDRGQPATFGVNQVIPGWVEALQLMNVGSKARLVIPPSLAYGENGAGQDIGPNAVLIFDVELVGIEPPAQQGQQPPGQPNPAGQAEGQPNQGQQNQQQEQKPPQE
ncbi:MAG TPA: FKBP-type peptidyl-prolyl cis-trans isomerase [Thermoanaerobaculia bacterium]